MLCSLTFGEDVAI